MNKFSSLFGQILQLFPQSEFCKAVSETKSEKNMKGFTFWQQFTAMLFCQLGQANSLREICGDLVIFLSLFDWAKFRITKGAVKQHLLLDHDGYFPVFANIT